MISVAEAEQILRDAVPRRPASRRSPGEAVGGILREDIRADRDYPPYDRVMMDGIAVASQALAAGVRVFRLEATALAGADRVSLRSGADGCVEAMTGAVLPAGCDTVLPVEDLRREGDLVHLRDGVAPTAGQFVHRQGSDRKRGDLLLRAGRLILAPQAAVAVSAGYGTLLVADAPSATILSTGDEIVELGMPIGPNQIRPSNAYGIAVALRDLGSRDVRLGVVRDDRDALAGRLAQALSETDVVVLSGGVSAGKVDFVPAVLAELGVERRFHKIAQRPGKPMWFGVSREGKPVFALPGNPVSSMVCFRRLVLPALVNALGGDVRREAAVVESAVAGDPLLTRFLPVSVRTGDDGVVRADPERYSGSGDLAALAESDGFVEIPGGCDGVAKGGAVRFHRWRVTC